MLHLPGKFEHRFFHHYKGLVTLVLVTHIPSKKGIMAAVGAWTSQLWSQVLGLQVGEQPHHHTQEYLHGHQFWLLQHQ